MDLINSNTLNARFVFVFCELKTITYIVFISSITEQISMINRNGRKGKQKERKKIHVV